MQNLLIHVDYYTVETNDDTDSPPTQSYVLNSPQSIQHIIDFIYEKYNFPNISSPDVVWVLEAGVFLAMFSPGWPEPRLLIGLDEAIASLDKHLSEINLFFRHIPGCLPEERYEVFRQVNQIRLSADNDGTKDYFTIPVDDEDDPVLSEEQQQKAALLSPDDLQMIDTELLKFCIPRWRKIAFVVGSAMGKINHFYRLPDIFYAQRVRILVAEGKLEGAGNLFRMGASEVRLPSDSKNDA